MVQREFQKSDICFELMGGAIIPGGRWVRNNGHTDLPKMAK